MFTDPNSNNLKVYDDDASIGEESTAGVDNEVIYDATY